MQSQAGTFLGRDRQGAAIAAGARVRLLGQGPSYKLSADTGTVVGADPVYDGYLLVRLDEPATYVRADGDTELLAEIPEADDNLLLLAPQSSLAAHDHMAGRGRKPMSSEAQPDEVPG